MIAEPGLAEMAPCDGLRLGPLSGARIGFLTSVSSMGGSEVALADTIDACASAGASVVCWSPPGAPVRQLLDGREASSWIQHRNWPVPSTDSGHMSPTQAASERAAGRSLVRRLCYPIWSGSGMGWARAVAGYFLEAGKFQGEIVNARLDMLFVNVNGFDPAVLSGRRTLGSAVVGCYHLSYAETTGSFLTRRAARWLKYQSLRACGLSVHVSAAARDDWCRRFRCPVGLTRVIHNGVAPVAARSREVIRTLGISDDAFVYCVPGRLHSVKGHDVLLEAVGSSRDRFGPISILICGDGPEQERLEAEVLRLGLSDVVRFLGWRSDLPQLLAACDAAVLPSVASENLSLAILESLMLGTPAVVTDVGGMAEAVQDGVTGYVVPRGSADALGSAMARLAADRPLARRMGRAGQADARNRFGHERMTTAYVALFAEVLADRQARK